LEIPNKPYVKNFLNYATRKKMSKPIKPIETELPLSVSVAGLLTGPDGKPEMRVEVFEKLFGIDEPALRRMAERGLFPAPVKRRLNIEKTLAGIFADLKTRAADTHASARLDKITFPSMDNLEAATGISKGLQQTAKKAGCLAFRDTRIYLLDLVRWIFKEAAGGHTADWGKLNEELDAKLKQVKLDGELRAVIQTTEAQECLQNFAAIVFNGFRRLEMETPRDLEMRDRAYIKAEMKAKVKAIKEQAQIELKKLAVAAELETAENKSV
jgi:hypothetical protein